MLWRAITSVSYATENLRPVSEVSSSLVANSIYTVAVKYNGRSTIILVDFAVNL